jgi:hypothetical protein
MRAWLESHMRDIGGHPGFTAFCAEVMLLGVDSCPVPRGYTLTEDSDGKTTFHTTWCWREYRTTHDDDYEGPMGWECGLIYDAPGGWTFHDMIDRTPKDKEQLLRVLNALLPITEYGRVPADSPRFAAVKEAVRDWAY